jgi:hypothetical protein
LATLYPDHEWRRKFIRILDVGALLRGSIIGKDYKIPDDLNNAIHLTVEGGEIAKTLTTKHDVPYKEAKLMCFLAVAYRELLVDVEKTNYPVLVSEISDQIKSNEIRHPFVFGRILYDRAAELFSDERKYLSVADTVRLLEGTPQGVWQVGELVTGPFGILHSSAERGLMPHTDIPLQHCADLSCNSIHYVDLTTDYEAPINFHRPKLSRLLEAGGREPSEWNGFIDDLIEETRKGEKSDDLDPGSLTYLLGDGLADSELRTLLRELLDATGPELRKVAAGIGMRGRAEDIVDPLERAQLLQLIMCTSGANISGTLDAVVRAGQIHVPVGEVRRARVNYYQKYGPWQLRAELGFRGVSFRAPASSLPVLRLGRLVGSLYDSDQVDDMQGLDWQLRHVDALTPAAKLAEYLRVATPEQAIRNLVLARRENTEKACKSLGLLLPASLSDDDEIVGSLLWKLGFKLPEMDAPHARFFARQDEIIRLARAAQLSSTVDEEPIRRAAGVYFESLEALLNDSLAYVTWGLKEDHYASERPYVFRASLDTLPAMATLSDAANSQNVGQSETVEFGELNTLYPLSRGFQVLANYLDGMRADADSYRRDPGHFPAYLERTDLQKFPFKHVHPFLDVQADAQMMIISGLREVTKKLLSHNVPEIRNDLTHFRRTAVDISEVIAGLEAVNQAVQQLDSLGFLRVPYIHSSTKLDEWGRRTVTLANLEGQPVSFTRPSAYDWLPLPSLTEAQYLMHSAVFGEPNEVLRFRPGYDSPYEDMWTGYPRRRAVRNNSVAKQSESGSMRVDATGRSSARAG